jgi:hypothetical protein
VPHQGRISGKTQHRSVLEYTPQPTGTLMGIDITMADVSVKLSVNEARRWLNRLGSNTCRCIKDCFKSSACSCKKGEIDVLNKMSQ